MRAFVVVVSALAACFLASVGASAQVSEAAALEHASQRGRMIYDFDKAAWVATDALRARFATPAAANIAGWIVEARAGGGEVVTFYRSGADGPVAAHVFETARARVTGQRFDVSGEDAVLTPVQRRMIAVRSVSQPKVTNCAEAPLNTVVVPPTDAGGVTEMYVLTSQTSLEVFPLGGHTLLTYEGATPVQTATRAFTRSCINLSTAPQGGRRPEALFITHILDPTPTEMHVFTSLAARMPLMVSTSSGLWEVSGANIRKVRNP